MREKADLTGRTKILQGKEAIEYSGGAQFNRAEKAREWREELNPKNLDREQKKKGVGIAQE